MTPPPAQGDPTRPLLEVQELRTWFHTDAGVARSVDGVSFTVGPGETVRLVEESGCGKSVTALSLLRLVQPPGRIEPGSRILFEGRDLLQLPEREMRRVRGNRIAMVFQEPMSALNPVFTVGDQIAEVARVHDDASKRESWKRAVEMLAFELAVRVACEAIARGNRLHNVEQALQPILDMADTRPGQTKNP